MSRDINNKARLAFFALIMLTSVIALSVAFAGSAAAQEADNGEVILLNETGDKDSTYDSGSPLQDAYDNAGEDYTIIVGSGTFTVPDPQIDGLTIEGAGMDETTLETDQMNPDATNLTLRDFTIDASGNNIRVDPGNEANGLRIVNVRVSDNQQTSIGLDITADGDTDTPTDKADGLYIENFHVVNATFKGIYLERASNATLKDIYVDGILDSGKNYANNGIDINLKYDDYENITIEDSVIKGVEEGTVGEANPIPSGAGEYSSIHSAVAVKQRDDGSYSGTPATLDGVTIDNVTVKNSVNGLRFGEPGVDYSSNPEGPTDVTITDSTFQNNDRYHVEDLPDSVDLDAVMNRNGNAFDRTVSSEIGIYSSIQPAIDLASDDTVIELSANNFTEQITIDKNLTLVGSGEGQTNITAPDSLRSTFTRAGDDQYPVITVNGTETDIQQLTVDGNGQGDGHNEFYGIAYVNASGTSSNITIEDVRETPLSGTQHGVGFAAFNLDTVERTITLQNSTLVGYQKNGFVARGEKLTGYALSNNVTGVGATDVIGQNGIQISGSATGVVKNNTVSGHIYTPTPKTTQPANIILFNHGSGETMVKNNRLKQGEVGVAVAGPGNVEITNNKFSEHSWHIFDYDIGTPPYVATLNAKALHEDNTFTDGSLYTVNDSNEPGSSVYGSIQTAIDDGSGDSGVSSGDTVHVYKGSYNESVTISTQNLTLEGPNAGLHGNSTDRSSEAVINDRVSIQADNVTIDGFEIRNTGSQGNADPSDYAGAVAVQVASGNNNVSVLNNSITDIGTNDNDANAIGVLANDGTSGITVDNNRISNLNGTDEDKGAVQAILIDEAGTPIESASVTNNVITNILDTRSTVAIRFNGDVSGAISGNEISDMNTEGTIPGSGGDPGGFTQVIALQKGGASQTGPSDVLVNKNTISEIETTTEENYARPYGIILGGSADASSITIRENNLLLDVSPGQRTESAVGIGSGTSETLDASENWWGDEDGPNGVNASSAEGNVATQPFLTAPIEELEETDDGTPRQFGTELRLDSGVSTIAFPAPSERTLNETVNTSNVETIYVFDNSEREWLGPGDYDPESEPDALDTFVVVVEEGETASIVMEFDNDFAVGETFLGSTEVESGEWNLVSPSLASDSRDDAFRGDVETDLASENPFQDPRRQPFDAGEVKYSPYRGYWVYVTDGEEVVTRNYEGTTLLEYLENVELAPED